MKTPEKILFVDDDQNLLEGLARQLCRQFDIETQPGPKAGLAAVERDPTFAVVVSDMRMPVMDGVQFLARVKALMPDSLRIMLTGFPELQTAIDAVNHGKIYRFLTKPCPREMLVAALEEALEQRRLRQTRVEFLESQLRNAQRLEMIGRCASGVFHELRNILSVISIHADLALGKNTAPPPLLKSFERIHCAAGNATKLTQQLLALGRPRERLQYAPLDLAKFLPEFTEMLRQVFPKSVSMQYECAPQLEPIRAEAGLLGQTLLNLALNARDAMPEGGTLRLHAALATISAEAAREFSEGRPGRFVCVSITDSGCGMNTEVRHRLFEPYFTTKPCSHGTGLGLALVLENVRQHEGWLHVRSKVGAGTTFQMYLPVWQSSEAPTPSTETHSL